MHKINSLCVKRSVSRLNSQLVFSLDALITVEGALRIETHLDPCNFKRPEIQKRKNALIHWQKFCDLIRRKLPFGISGGKRLSSKNIEHPIRLGIFRRFRLKIVPSSYAEKLIAMFLSVNKVNFSILKQWQPGELLVTS